MKISTQLLALFVGVLMLHFTLEYKGKGKYKYKKGKVNLAEEMSTSKPEAFSKIWQQLFHSQRGGACKSDKIKAKLKMKLKHALKPPHAQKAKKAHFEWLKEWGYGKAAYFLDFVDPVLKKDVLAEFKKIYKDMMAISNKDSKQYKDMLDFKKLLGGDKAMIKKFGKNLKKLNKNYEPKIYKKSVNTVQVHTAMPKWKWEIDKGKKDFALSFVKKYDMNGDGRLNPRELILAALEHNKHLLGTHSCNHCFEGVIDKIDAMFQYLDCDHDGKITAEDLWIGLPKMKRSTSKYNIFAIGRKEGVRTDAINDFILKNNKMSIGALNRNEFRHGILYGIWDRQTDYYKIIDGDEKTLKQYRWSSGRTVDSKAFQRLKEIKLLAMKKKKKKLV